MRLALVLPPLCQKLFVYRLGAAFDLQAAGQNPVHAQSACDAGIHCLPQRIQPIIESGAGMHHLIRALHRGNAQAGALTHCKHLLRRTERMWISFGCLLRVQIA